MKRFVFILIVSLFFYDSSFGEETSEISTSCFSKSAQTRFKIYLNLDTNEGTIRHRWYSEDKLLSDTNFVTNFAKEYNKSELNFTYNGLAKYESGFSRTFDGKTIEKGNDFTFSYNIFDNTLEYDEFYNGGLCRSGECKQKLFCLSFDPDYENSLYNEIDLISNKLLEMTNNFTVEAADWQWEEIIIQCICILTAIKEFNTDFTNSSFPEMNFEIKFSEQDDKNLSALERFWEILFLKDREYAAAKETFEILKKEATIGLIQDIKGVLNHSKVSKDDYLYTQLLSIQFDYFECTDIANSNAAFLNALDTAPFSEFK